MVVCEAGIPIKKSNIQILNTHLIKSAFHGSVIDFLFRVGQMTGIGGDSPGHLFVWNHPHVTQRVNGIITHKKLITFSVNQSIGVSSSIAFRTSNHI